MNSEIEVRMMPSKDVEFRMQTEGTNTILTGYASVFNSLSEVLSDDDQPEFREIVMPGAFTRTLATNPDVRLLVNHEGTPLARTRSKTLSLSQDDRGLAFRAVLDPHNPYAAALISATQRGDIDQCSFSFRCVARSMSRDESGMVIRELRDVDLSDGDVSAVNLPAYKGTSLGVRNYDVARKEVREYRSKQKAAESKGGLSAATAERMIYLLSL